MTPLEKYSLCCCRECQITIMYIIVITHLLCPRLGVRCLTCTGNRKVVEEYEASRKESPALPPPLYLLVKTRRSQKIHPRASRDRDGPSIRHLVNMGFIPWPRWATTIPHHKTPPSVSYTHLRAHETPEHLVCRLLLEKKK